MGHHTVYGKQHTFILQSNTKEKRAYWYFLILELQGPYNPEYMDRNLTFTEIFGPNLVGPKISDFFSSNSHVLGPQIIIGSIKKW